MEQVRDRKSLALRLPMQVRRWIGVEAAKNLRSINSEITLRLEAAMSAERGISPSAGGAPAVGQEA